MCIAVLIYGSHATDHMASVVFELERLEAEGQIVSSVDEGSVKRWTLVDAEHGAAMELGAEILMRGSFKPTDGQRQRLGLNLVNP